MSLIEQLSRIPNPDTRMDRYMERQGGIVVSSTDQDLMILFNYDPAAADESLMSWALRHERDCSVLGMNPARVKIYGTIRRDLENPVLFTKQGQRRDYALKKAQERREWDGL